MRPTGSVRKPNSFRSKRGLLAIAVAVLAAIPVFVSADSLWAPTTKSIIVDPKAHEVGDILTILVVESASAAQTANTAYTKSLQHGTGAGVGPIFCPGASPFAVVVTARLLDFAFWNAIVLCALTAPSC